MIRSKLLKLATYNRPLALMSTGVESSTKEKKLEHYKNLQALQDESEAKPPGWDEAKPFSAIPGPRPAPLVGNAWRFVLPKFGTFYGMDILDILKQMRGQYGEITVLGGLLGGINMVILFNPTDIETLFRNEGIWPIRRNLPAFAKYMEARQGIFPDSGLVTHHGEKWFQARSIINPILMQPRNIARYTETMDAVADDLISNMKYLAEQNPHGEMPSDFANELYKWALESVGVVTLDKRLGCLSRNLDKESEPQKLINSALQMFQLLYKLDFQPSLYKYFDTPNWKKFAAGLDYMINTNIKHINEAIEKLEKDPIDNENETKSALQQLLKRDKYMAISMAKDMLLAGIDTTGRVFAASLYYLSRNPDKQEELRKEAKALLPDKNSLITKEILAKAQYLKACVKEVTRLAPIGVGNTRTTVKDLVLGGYQIPKGTDVMAANLVACSDDKNFARATEFLPERWLSNAPEELSRKTTNPFVFQPFGYGPRSCVGKRLATLEIETATLKVIRNFKLTWPHEDMVFATRTIYGIDRPLKLHVKEVEN